MSANILCIGDIHLGRRPARLPEEVLERVGAVDLGPAAAWRAAVAEAVRRGADAVLLAGDVVEEEDDFYEAYGDLAAGVERLLAAGISVLGVAGNHDVEVLPRLADALPGFRLLGRGGRWEAVDLETRAGVALRVLGWSFPEPTVRSSPLAAALPARGAGATVGLLHCDRDQSGSRYAPVRSAELDAAPVDAWLLGHIHKPDALGGPRPIGYLGSLVGLDPGEPGAHGPWLLEIGTGRESRMQQLPLAPLRWEAVDVDVQGMAEPGEVHARITGAIEVLHQRIAGAGHGPRAVGCRVRLRGRTPHRLALARLFAAEDALRLLREQEGIAYFIERVQVDALPALDLDELARGRDPAALLARRLLVLRRDAADPERRRLLAAGRRRLGQVAGQPVYAGLGVDAPDEQRTAVILEQAALRALDALLAQHDSAA